MSATERDHEAALEVLALSRQLDVPVSEMTGALFREHGGSYSNGAWGRIHALALGEYDRSIATPPGHYVRESTVRTDGRGKVDHVYHKTRALDAKAATLDALLEKAAKAEPLAPVPAPDLSRAAAEYMNLYVQSDAHVGLYCAARVSGQKWGRAEALDMGKAAIELLIARAPEAATACYCDCGDLLHASGPRSTTVKGTMVDTDGLFHEALIDAYRLKEYCIQALLRTHDTVHVRSSKGNHGGVAEVAVDAMLAARFADEPRVDAGVPREAMVNPAYVSILEFGKNLLAFAHGDKAKISEVLGMVSNDYPEAWGRTRWRRAIGGHTHHHETNAVHGGQWETFGVLCPLDQWHASMPWRSVREMQLLTFHEEYGLTGRTIATAAELQAILGSAAKRAA